MRGVSLRAPAGQHRDRLAFWMRGTLAPAARSHGLGVAFSHHRVHLRPVVGKLDRGAVVGVAVAQVELAGAQVGGFQVGGMRGSRSSIAWWARSSAVPVPWPCLSGRTARMAR